MENKAIRLKLVLVKIGDYDGWGYSNDLYDLSKYIQVGATQTLCLDDTLKTMGITLMGLPFKNEFLPTSIFRLTIEQDYEQDYETYTRTKEYIYALQEDNVSQPNLADDKYFIHELSLIDGAMLCQQRPVDNISVTYKLQNVITQAQSVDLTEPILPNINNANKENAYLPPNNRQFIKGYDENEYITNYYGAFQYYWVETTLTYPVGAVSISNPVTATYDEDFTTLNSLMKNVLYDPNDATFTFDVPMLVCNYGKDNTRDYEFMSFLPVDVTIYDTDIATSQTTETTFTAYPSRFITDTTYTNKLESWAYKDGIELDEHYVYQPIQHLGLAGIDTRIKVSMGQDMVNDVIVGNEIQNRTITLTTQANHKYQFYFNRHNYTKIPYVTSLVNYNDLRTQSKYLSNNTYTEQNYELGMNFTLYVYDANDLLENLFKEADQTDAYYLFQKSQLASSPLRNKTNNIAYYNTNLPFTVSNSDRDLLRKTKVIESDFEGKNLWEIFTEIGKYIHAKPYISDFQRGKFVVSFLKYGSPEINTKETTTNSIFNSKFGQEYVSALTTYIENYFNLGSEITEYLHITSESEDSLVYNDVVKLQTKYPILEILGLYANDGNDEKDITKYLFEYNIYKILDYDSSNPNKPNKPYAMYYHFGTNQIEGMQFVEPKPTGVECAYSFKNILGRAFNIPSANVPNIQAKDYTFRIVYRAKDNVRVDTTRPDLRKYLKNGNYDLRPLHTQFNNQQEKLVSSDSFGNNAYGKLIRTGNSVYSYVNWCDNLDALMENGDLYKLDNQMYYVSKTIRVYYSDHIEERVELTQDFNRLSQIIGIPSEPRFYEISEKNIINRDIAINDYVMISSYEDYEDLQLDELTYIEKNTFYEIFSSTTQTKYVMNFFKGDKDKTYDDDSNYSNYQCLLPVNTYASKNTYTLEWDLHDNYSAGDQIKETTQTLQWGLNLYSFLNTINNVSLVQPYMTKNPVRYVDVFGRADLVDFIVFKDLPSITNITFNDFINQLPEIQETNLLDITYKNNIFGTSNPISEENLDTTDSSGVLNNIIDQYLGHYRGYIIAKDNREKLSFNYNVQLLTNSDKIILGNTIWNRDYTGDYHIVYLNKEINKFSADKLYDEDFIYMSSATNYNSIVSETNNIITIDLSSGYNGLTDEEKANIKAFALVRELDNLTASYQLVIGKNADTTNGQFIFYVSKYDETHALTNRNQLLKYLGLPLYNH